MNLLIKLFSSSYEELWKAIIRPNRDEYTQKDLGPERFILKQKYYKRSDFTLKNKRNIKLKCSFWEPYDEEREYPLLPCVVYLHGNSSSRCEALLVLKYLLPLNITVFAFDFAGCGQSEGEYISLGWYETLDVECIINYLRRSNKVSSIGLWGRSMGAVTSLIYASKDQSMSGIFLDSPFFSLNLLIDEFSKEKVPFPNFFVKQVVNTLKETIKEKGEFNIDDIEPVKFAKKCFVPAFFSHGKDDTFVNMHHCKDLYNEYAGEKNILLVDGEHNSLRPNTLSEKVADFFYNALKCKYIRELNDYCQGFKLIYNDCNFITPKGDKENTIKNMIKNIKKSKSVNCRNNGDTVPVGEMDIEEPILDNNIVKDKTSDYYDSKNENNYNNNTTEYKFRIYRNNDLNSDYFKNNIIKTKNSDNIINIKTISNMSNYKKIKKDKINTKTIANMTNYKKIKKQKNKIKKTKKTKKSVCPLTTSKKEQYHYQIFSKLEGKNNISTSESNFLKYKLLNKENLMIHAQKKNNEEKKYIRIIGKESNQINDNKCNSVYNMNVYNSNTYKFDGDIFSQKVKLNFINQNIETNYTFSQQNTRYLSPTPYVDQSQMITNISYNNNSSMSPSSYVMNRSLQKDMFSLYPKYSYNNLYKSGYDISLNACNVYNSQTTINGYRYNY